MNPIMQHKHEFIVPHWDKPQDKPVRIKCSLNDCQVTMLFPAKSGLSSSWHDNFSSAAEIISNSAELVADCATSVCE